jgi:glycosyltransferase involved in cell wall biosynthesis
MAPEEESMKILGIIDNQFYLSGVNAYWSSMIRACELMGHQAHTMVLDDGTCSWNGNYFEHLAGMVHRMRILPGSAKEHAEDLFAVIGPDIVIHHYSDLGMNLSLGAKRHIAGAPWKDLYVCHSDDPDHYNRIQKRRHDITHVICVSETCMEHVQGTLGFAPADTSLIKYFFLPQGKLNDSGAIEASYREPLRSANILYAGRLESYQKRAGDLGKFAQALDALRIPYILHIAGSGSLQDNLLALLKNAVIDGKVIFHGYLDEKRLFDLMRESNIYVSFSEFEGISTSLIQSISFGLIPLITPTRSGSDFLTHRQDALFFNVGDVCGAAHMVLDLLEDGSLYPSLRKKGAEILRNCFSHENARAQLSEFFQKINGH